MGDLETTVPTSELRRALEALDSAGVNRFGLKRVRADPNLAKQLTWTIHQSPATDFRIEVPKTPLSELANDLALAMRTDTRQLVRRMSATENPLTMPNRHLALLDYGPEAGLQEASSTLRNLSRRRTRPGPKGESFLEASLRDLLLLEQQHCEKIEPYDIYLAYVPWDEGDGVGLSFRLHTGTRGERLLETVTDIEEFGDVRFLARKS